MLAKWYGIWLYGLNQKWLILIQIYFVHILSGCYKFKIILQPLGRYQYVLNLAIPEAYDYIHQCIYDLLSQNKISYIKWDMNRDLVQAGGVNGQAGSTSTSFATYRLIEQLHHEFPKVEIESCASGGARADLGILRYTNRVWTSVVMILMSDKVFSADFIISSLLKSWVHILVQHKHTLPIV